jgi:hypothetical protein
MKATQLEKILNDVYGVGVVVAPREAVLWAAEKIENKDEARKQLKAVNRIRAKHGAPLAYAYYGHHAF